MTKKGDAIVVTVAVHFPQSLAGRRFCQFFSHRYHFIEARVNGQERPQWQTVTAYPIEHRNLWSRFNDPKTLIGLSFGSTTRYLLADIDVGSPYHPYQDERAFRKLLGLFEDVGLPVHVVVRSSASEGLHLYFPLPDAYPTYEIASLAKNLAARNGFRVVPGSLEFFPNTKVYSPGKPTAYKAHRLPLQQGSYLLDKDYLPYSDDIEHWLELMEAGALAQDQALFETALQLNRAARQQGRALAYGGKAAAERWRADLEEQIREGWTDYHQTNDLLRTIATYGRVFERLSQPELTEFVSRHAQTLPGYREYCRHQHEIERRAHEWSRCVEKFYYPYGSEPTRVGSFADMRAEGKRENKVNGDRQAGAIERIKMALQHLQETLSRLPSKVGELKALLLTTIQEKFGVRPSDSTLRKYKDLWHPTVVGQAARQSEPVQETNDEPSHTPHAVVCEIEAEPKPSNTKPDNDSASLATPPLVMKVLDWERERRELLYGGRLVTGLVEIVGAKRPQLRFIEPRETVVITNSNHTSFFYPDREERLLVYVKPVVGSDDWQCYGIAVHAKDLHPIHQEGLSLNADGSPPTIDNNGFSLADDG